MRRHVPEREPLRTDSDINAWLELAHAEILSIRKLVAESQAINACKAINWTPLYPIAFNSQYGEDVYLWQLFGGQISGVYLEAGAYDGTTLSVTHALGAVGWRGYLVEPNATAAALAKANRPGSVVINAALSSECGVKPFPQITELGGDALTASLDLPSETTIEVLTIDHVLAPENGFDIDVMVLDVEGHEAECIAGMVASRPKVCVIEDSARLDESKVVPLMLERGYALVATLWCNRVYVHRSQPGLLARAERMQRG